MTAFVISSHDVKSLAGLLAAPGDPVGASDGGTYYLRSISRAERYQIAEALLALCDRAERAEAELFEMTRRRDAWREKAKDVDALRAAVRAGIKEAGPANLSRIFLRGALAESERRLAEIAAERDALLTALHDAINRPKGVVPASAERFYDPARAAKDQPE